MSTNFYVYPGKHDLPTFKELLELSNQKINEYLSSKGIQKKVNLEVEIHNNKSHKKVDFNLNDRVLWDEDTYAWFYFTGIQGGTDSYFFKTDEADKEVWQDEYLTNSNACKMKDVINNSLEIGYHWSFRRSAGQPGMITLTYGFLAISLAKLTNGFIYSDDGAWDYSQLPALPDDFNRLYFNECSTKKDEYQNLVKNCMKLINCEK